MRFVLVDPRLRGARFIQAKDIGAAITRAGLDRNETGHGIIAREQTRGIGIFVHEFSLFVPVQRQVYFAIGRHLYAGNAVLYAFDYVGKTIDFALPIPMLTFFGSALEVEEAIHRDLIDRPQLVLNGEVLWSWPAEAPPQFCEAVA